MNTCIIALHRSTFLKEKQIHHVIEFSFLFGLTDSLFQLDNDSTNIKNRIGLDMKLTHEKITQYIPAI